MNRAYIAIGSNQGDSKENARRAMERLQEFSDHPIQRSHLYDTTPVECPPDSPRFINAVVCMKPKGGETPESLLETLKIMEWEFGRQTKRVHNEPRPLDLDLICFGVEMRNTETLRLPHPRAHQRRFVLEPLAEIAPDLVLPGQPETVRDTLSKLQSEEIVVKLEEQ